MRTRARRAAWVGAIILAVVLGGAFAGYSVARAWLFPGRCRRMVAEAAGEFGLEPLLVAAIGHHESGFDPHARSPAGARGLMQLMPATAREVAARLGLEEYREAALDDPEVNVRIGCAYVRELLDAYGGDERLALAAYNAGRGNVDRWLKEAHGDVRQAIGEHAFPETRRYVRGVLGTRWLLRRLNAIRRF